MNGRKGSPTRLVVIGGGFTGAALAIHAIRASQDDMEITIIEPAAELGRGTAYGTDDPAHRINVPSDRMTLTKDDPEGATRWLFDQGILPDAGSDDGEGRYYVPRRSYGAFIAASLRSEIEQAGGRITFRHVRDSANAVIRGDGAWRISTEAHGELSADLVALSFGHAAPSAPCPIEADVAKNPKFVPNPWAADALAAIGEQDSILIVGTGLTMADVVMSLRATGRNGPITAISRRGLVPGAHGLFRSDVDLFEGAPPPRTALGLLRAIRRRVRDTEAEMGWQPVVDSLRAQLPDIWNGLPAAEQRRVLSRLLPYWDVHRFRIAPQISAALERDRAAGGLSIEKAGLSGLAPDGDGLKARLKRKGGPAEERSFDAVVLCTGPDKNVAANPLVAALLAQKLACLDPAGLGLRVDRSSRVLDPNDQVTPGLFAFGPMTRGSFGEMTGAPDIASHIERIAGDLFGKTFSLKGNRL
ncbi:FAD/NAD(P)-binding protein [Kaistia sp. 32K]|uniref:FAD/NAD(P)-binding protein n=1 Tax=Kaistia sp. 32K TaxID=2795690 RepID=UPI001914DB77|nr:FAD/NAD(P)-binding protein [Kaistia sp. 32K]